MLSAVALFGSKRSTTCSERIMSQIHVEAAQVIDARPEDVYAVLRDYRVGHPAILPKPYFEECTVLEGGVGAGTVIRVRMNVMGAKREYRIVVTEPQPGRLLMETDADAGVVTTFTLEPVNDGQQTRLTITTDSKPSPGITGVMERLVNPPVSRRIYHKELAQLNDYMRGRV
jgi:hypothetical protein